jgi:hypothetical protein
LSRILSSTDSPVAPAFDKFWDSPMSRREAQIIFNKIGRNFDELMGMADTASILINFICEKKLGIVDRTEVDAYVALKFEQLKARREAMQLALARGENPDAQPNS